MRASANAKKKSTAGKAVVVKGNVKNNIITESLLITDAEKHGTSQSMYGDSSARIFSNVSSIHDRFRHRAYDVLLRLVKGKRILHLSCGMGLYGMLMSKAQAEHVVAVDHSSVVDAAREVAQKNKLNNITFIRGHLRDVLDQIPSVAKPFDFILCEWMGSFILNERVLADVLYARDKLLAPDGSVCPSESSLHICGVSDYRFRLDTEDFWSDVYGFNMEPMKPLVRQEVEICSIPSSNIVTSTCRMQTVKINDIPRLEDDELETYAAEAAKAEEERLRNTGNPILDKWTPFHVAAKGFEAEFDIVASCKTTIHYLTIFVDAVYNNNSHPGASFVMPINPGGPNPWTEASVGLLDSLPVMPGEHIRGTVKVHTPAAKNGKITVVEVTARTEGKVALIETTGKYFYQAY